MKFGMHVSCIFIMFILPEIIMNYGDTRHNAIPLGVYAKTIIYIIAFYLNYFLIFDKCFNKPHGTSKYIMYNIVLFIGAMAVIYATWELAASSLPVHEEVPYPPHLHDAPSQHWNHEPREFQVGELQHTTQTITRFMRDAVMLILTITLSLAIKFNNKWVNSERNKQMSIAAQREEELKNLRSQINPHFLINTLNSIYALIDICPDSAKRATHEFSHMMRYILYESPDKVSLTQEIKFINNYIELMKLRLGKNVNMKVNLDEGNCGEMQIAPLLFVTIVENVFKHGNTGNPSHIIEISITADNGIVTCRTFNYFSSSAKSKSDGIGLSNLNQRINLLYGDNASLETHTINNTFTVELKIKLNNNLNSH